MRPLLGLTAAALLLAACGQPTPPPPSIPAPAPSPALPPSPAPIPAVVPPSPPSAFDPSAATATLLIRAAARGSLPRMRPIKFEGCAKCAEEQVEEVLTETIVADGGRLANVIAWVSRGAERWTYAPAGGEAALELRRCILVPHVLTLRAGQPLRVANPVHPFLHFHGVSPLNLEVRSTIERGTSFVTRFATEEVGVRLNCDIHTWMGAWVGVFSHPFHGVTDRAGTMTLQVPPGEYEVSSWHEYPKWAGKPAPVTVTVADGETKEIEFVFEAR